MEQGGSIIPTMTRQDCTRLSSTGALRFPEQQQQLFPRRT
jgi:hypothetical protein